MIDSYFIKITQPSDFRKLKDKIKGTHIDDDTIKELQHFFGGKCDMIQVENPYSDKDYLSTYYIHYSKKYRDFPKKCYRIHLYFNEQYCGFVTLRPTCHRKIGRSYIHPLILLNKPEQKENSETVIDKSAQSYYLMAANFKANILGDVNEVLAFPWMHQEPDVSCCAHVALWSIIRYFGNRHSSYSDATLGDVVEKIQYSYDRKIPTRGLREEQISNLLIQYGFSTLIRSNRVNDEIFTYIESGLPVIGIIPTDNDEAHAVCLIGHGPVHKVDNFKGLFEKYEIETKDNKVQTITTDIILSTKFLDSLIVNDDNYLPYRLVYKKVKELEHCDPDYDPKYIVDNIKSFIIPLYEKMQLPYNEVYNVVMTLLRSGTLKALPTPKILRFFITSSNSFKKSLDKRGISPNLQRILLKVNMPKFIWCVEISSEQNYRSGLVDGCIVIDATESSEADAPFIAIHDRQQISYFNDKRNIIEKFEIRPYRIYENNLKEFNWNE